MFSSLELTTICLGQNKILSRNLSQLYWWLVFGKLDIDLKTYEFSCYTANMCYDPRQFWPTPTKDSYFPLRKLDLKRFAEATKTIWINNWIRLQGQTSSQLSKVLSRQDFTKRLFKIVFLKFLLHIQNTCLCNRENILFVLNIQKYAQRNLVALILASDRTNTSSGSPSNHETSFSNVYHLVSKDWFSGGPQSFSLNPQLWCFKLLRDTMTLAHFLVESAM